MPLEFHPAKPGDIGLLLGLVRAYYALDHLPYDETSIRAALVGLMAEPELGRVWLIHEGGDVIGYAVLTLGYSLEYRGRDAFIDELYLVEPHRGQGLGSEVMAFLESSARALGVRALHLEVEKANSPAQALYRHRGYRDNDRQLLTRILES